MAAGEGAGPPTEATLERTLTAVGLLLRRRADVGAPDPAFVWALRARLLGTETGTAPDPPFVRSPPSPPLPRGRLAGTARDRGGVRERRWRGVVAAIAFAIAILALLAVAAVALVAVVWVDLAVAALVAAAILVMVVGRRRH